METKVENRNAGGVWREGEGKGIGPRGEEVAKMCASTAETDDLPEEGGDRA